MSNYLTTDGLKKFSLLPEAPLKPEARGICHMVNPALLGVNLITAQQVKCKKNITVKFASQEIPQYT